MALRKISIAIPAGLMVAIDLAASARHESRNQFVMRVLQRAVRARRDAEITKRLNALFRDPVLVIEERRRARDLDAAGPAWTDERW